MLYNSLSISIRYKYKAAHIRPDQKEAGERDTSPGEVSAGSA